MTEALLLSLSESPIPKVVSNSSHPNQIGAGVNLSYFFYEILSVSLNIWSILERPILRAKRQKIHQTMNLIILDTYSFNPTFLLLWTPLDHFGTL